MENHLLLPESFISNLCVLRLERISSQNVSKQIVLPEKRMKNGLHLKVQCIEFIVNNKVCLIYREWSYQMRLIFSKASGSIKQN